MGSVLKIAVSIAAAAICSFQATPQKTPPAGAISGVVVDAVTGQPLRGATVTLARIGSQLTRIPPRVVTDAKGRFVYVGLDDADDYFLGARHVGYEYTRYGWTAPGQTLAIADIRRINIAAGEWVADIKIPLWRLPSITGRVVDERGEAVVGVAVRAFSRAIIGGQLQSVGSSVVTTDDRGIYRITGLAPGRYIVAVLSVQSTVLATTPEAPMVRAVGELQTGGIMSSGPAAVAGPAIDLDGRRRLALTSFTTPPPPSSSQSRAYPQQFYPGVGTASEASEIELAYRQAQTGVDFQLRPLPAVRVSGRVEGVPAPGLLLRLMPAGNEALGFGGEAATTIIEGDGTFAFFNVPAGRYTLLAQASVMDFTSGGTSSRLPVAPGFPGGGAGVGSRNGAPGLSYLSHYGARAPSWGRMPVNVGDSNVDRLVLTMHPVGKISGRIVFAEGVTVPANAFFRVTAEPANGDPSLGLAGSNPATFANGAYTFVLEGLLGGTYLIDADTSGLTTMSVMAGGRDVTSTGIDAAATPDVNDVVITLTDKRQEIRGVVSVAPDRTAGVIVFPVDRALWANYGWNARQFRTTRVASNGAFSLRPHRAGEYYLIAVDATKLDAWTDPRFLTAAAPLATRVSVSWGETRTQDLTWREVIIK